MDMSNLQTKMKILQKHQVFEAEILAHGNIIESVQQVSRCTKVTNWLSSQSEIILYLFVVVFLVFINMFNTVCYILFIRLEIS